VAVSNLRLGIKRTTNQYCGGTDMLTTTVAGRTWNFKKAVGRNAAAGNGFTQPYDVALGPEGVIYVLSRGAEGVGGVVAPNKRIGKLTMDDQFLGDFGHSEFVWPVGLAVDSEGNLYCSDEHLNTISSYNEDGERIAGWGEPGSDEGQLNAPNGIEFDADDNIYVVDSGNNRVQKFDKSGNFLLAFGSAGSDYGQFNSPWGITIDSKGDVYVADWGNNRAQKFSAGGTHLLTFGGSEADGGELDHPASVAVDSEGDVYVSDWGNKRIQIYEPDGTIITALYGDAIEFSAWAEGVINANPDAGKAYRRVKDRTPIGLFNRPVGMVIDADDNLIVADSTRGRLQVYTKENNYLDPQFNL